MNLEIVVQTLSECGIPATNQCNYLKIGSTSLEVNAGIMKSRKFIRRFRNSKHFFCCINLAFGSSSFILFSASIRLFCSSAQFWASCKTVEGSEKLICWISVSSFSHRSISLARALRHYKRVAENIESGLRNPDLDWWLFSLSESTMGDVWWYCRGFRI